MIKGCSRNLGKVNDFILTVVAGTVQWSPILKRYVNSFAFGRCLHHMWVSLEGARPACCNVPRTAPLLQCVTCDKWWHRFPCGKLTLEQLKELRGGWGCPSCAAAGRKKRRSVVSARRAVAEWVEQYGMSKRDAPRAKQLVRNLRDFVVESKLLIVATIFVKITYPLHHRFLNVVSCAEIPPLLLLARRGVAAARGLPAEGKMSWLLHRRGKQGRCEIFLPHYRQRPIPP